MEPYQTEPMYEAQQEESDYLQQLDKKEINTILEHAIERIKAMEANTCGCIKKHEVISNVRHCLDKLVEEIK